jgi:hypothetical protein
VICGFHPDRLAFTISWTPLSCNVCVYNGALLAIVIGLTLFICTSPSQYCFTLMRKATDTPHCNRTLMSSLVIHNKSYFRCPVVKHPRLSTNVVTVGSLSAQSMRSMRYKICKGVHRTRVSLPYCHRHHFHTASRRNCLFCSTDGRKPRN